MKQQSFVLLFCLLVKVLLVKSENPTPLTRAVRAYRVRGLDDKISSGGSLLTIKSVSEIQCTDECAKSKNCLAFFYNPKTRSCHLQGSRWDNDTSALQTEYGCRYYRLIRERPIDCYDLLKDGKTASGVYTIYLRGVPKSVYCDQDTDGGGWLVLQRRIDGTEDFYRMWDDYESGFGDINSEFWIGNKDLSSMTARRNYALRIDLDNFFGDSRYAYYQTFSVGDASTKYTLEAEEFSGTAGNSLSTQTGQKFSTRDQDNDLEPSYSCAVAYKGAWWYIWCHQSNLNGQYLGASETPFGQGLIWRTFMGYYWSMKRTEMKFRPSWL